MLILIWWKQNCYILINKGVDSEKGHLNLLMKLYFIFIARQYFLNKMPYYAVAKGRKPGIYTTW